MSNDDRHGPWRPYGAEHGEDGDTDPYGQGGGAHPGHGRPGQGQAYGGGQDGGAGPQGQGYGAPPAYGIPGQGAPAHDAAGYGAPGHGTQAYGTPGYGTQGTPEYGTPEYGTPGSGTPGYGPSGYDESGYNAAGYGTPAYDAGGRQGPADAGVTGYGASAYGGTGYTTPGYDAPGYGTPGHGTPGHGTPGNDSPGYDSPGYDTPGYDGYGGPGSATAGASGGGHPQPQGVHPAETYPGETSPAAPFEAPANGGQGAAGRTVPAPRGEGEPRIPERISDKGVPARPRRPGGQRAGGARPGYGSDEFAFVDDEAEQAEDVIDWLSFAETRSERRDERRRGLRLRLIALVAVVAVAALGVGGYIAWDAWKGDDKPAAAAPGVSGAVLIQLRNQEGKAASNVVFALNPDQGSASMLTVSADVTVASGLGPAALGQLMADEGPGASRDALSDLIGVRMDGSWVINEPVLQGLVDLVGGIELNADVEVKGADGKPLVTPGRNPANGAAALAYAKYRQEGEAPGVAAERFGRVIQAALASFPTDPDSVLSLLANMANVADPSLPDDKLSGLLASLAKAVQAQKMQARTLPVAPDGRLEVQAAAPIVKELLGGTVRQGKNDSGPARVMIDDATGKEGGLEDARVKLVNAGYTYVPGGVAGKAAQATSVVQYADDTRKDAATQIAMTLRLPGTAVRKAEGEMLADIVVTLGRDYRMETPK